MTARVQEDRQAPDEASKEASRHYLEYGFRTGPEPSKNKTGTAAALLRTASLSLVFIAVSISLTTGCSDVNGVVNNTPGDSVPAALDLQSCEALAAKDFERPGDPAFAERDTPARSIRIVHLANGTNVREREFLNYKDHHLVPWKPSDPPISSPGPGYLGAYEWVIPAAGKYAGIRVCVAASMRFGRYAPL